MERSKYEIKGKKLTCGHCKESSFEARSVLLNTGGLSLVGLDFLDKSAKVFVCRNCGNLMWFLDPEITSEEIYPDGAKI